MRSARFFSATPYSNCKTKTLMKPSMLAKLDQLSNRLEEVGDLLMQEDATSNMDNYRKLTREHAELTPLASLYATYIQADKEVKAAQDMLADLVLLVFVLVVFVVAKARMVLFVVV